jgi:glycosyltransferase involved in cell wall biosynthesis
MPSPEFGANLCVGYVVKRFPRASETFIAREILELERRGVKVHVFALRPADTVQPHAWLGSLRADVTLCGPLPLKEAWVLLEERAARGTAPANRVHRVLGAAIDHPAGRGRRYLCEAVAVARAAEERGVRHLHAHFANHPAFVAMLASALSGITYSFTAHAKDIYAVGPTPATWRRQLHNAAFAVTVTEANRDYIEKIAGPAACGSLRTLYNGVDLSRPPAAARAGEPNRLRLVCVARLIEKKGVDILLEAIGRLQRTGTAVECVIVGDGPRRASLEAQAAALGIGESVLFAGAMPHQDVMEQLRAAEIFVLPCRIASDGDRDALPTAILEAMAAGVPCVSTPVGGIPEMILQEKTGLMVPAEDPPALAAAIRRLLEDDLLRRRMRSAARKRAENLFSTPRNVTVLHDWFVAASQPSPERRGQPALITRQGA